MNKLQRDEFHFKLNNFFLEIKKWGKLKQNEKSGKNRKKWKKLEKVGKSWKNRKFEKKQKKNRNFENFQNSKKILGIIFLFED